MIGGRLENYDMVNRRYAFERYDIKKSARPAPLFV